MSAHIKRYAPAYTVNSAQFEAGAALAGLHAEWSAVRSACLAYLVFGMPIDIAASTHGAQASLVRDALIKIDQALKLAAIAANVAAVPQHPHPMPDTGRAGRVSAWEKMRLGFEDS